MTAATPSRPRTLGTSGIAVQPIGLGCMSLSGAYGRSDDAEGIRVIHHAIDHGVTFLDSSDMYGWGHNESLLGKALTGGRRDKVVLATKFGQTQKPGGANGVDGSPAFQHRVDPSVPIEDTVGAMGELVKAGKVRAIGLSEASPETISRANKTHPIAAVQSEYSLLYRVHAEETLATTRPLGISFVAYSPLGRSLLTGAVRQATAGAAIRASLRTISPATSSRLRPSRRSLATGSASRARWRSPGCSRKAPTSCRSPAPSAANGSTRTSPRSRSP